MRSTLIPSHTRITAASVVAVMLFLGLSACRKEKTDTIANFADRRQVPGLSADSVTTLVSDSGVLRYKVVSMTWQIFDEVEDPYWYFPDKVHFERFNDSLQVESVVDGDTAYYYYERKLWKLIRNVHVMNLNGEEFETPLLFWDQEAHRVHSDSAIHIRQAEQTLDGIGFESDERMEKYRVFNIKGIIPMDAEE